MQLFQCFWNTGLPFISEIEREELLFENLLDGFELFIHVEHVVAGVETALPCLLDIGIASIIDVA
jgi:hypothetical protein